MKEMCSTTRIIKEPEPVTREEKVQAFFKNLAKEARGSDEATVEIPRLGAIGLLRFRI